MSKLVAIQRKTWRAGKRKQGKLLTRNERRYGGQAKEGEARGFFELARETRKRSRRRGHL